MHEPPEPIRPAVWLFAIACTAFSGLLVFLVLSASNAGPNEADRERWEAERWPSARAAAPAEPWGRPRQDRGTGAWSGDGLGAPPPIFDPARPQDQDDPQLRAMRRTVGLVADGGVAPPFYPTHRTARLASVSGNVDVSVGASCEVRVLPVRTHSFNCLVRVMCDDVVLYPDEQQNAGYVPCNVEDGNPTRAVDDGFTHADGDPTVELDMIARRISVTDDQPGGRHFAAELVIEPLRL